MTNSITRDRLRSGIDDRAVTVAAALEADEPPLWPWRPVPGRRGPAAVGGRRAAAVSCSYQGREPAEST